MLAVTTLDTSDPHPFSSSTRATWNPCRRFPADVTEGVTTVERDSGCQLSSGEASHVIDEFASDSVLTFFGTTKREEDLVLALDLDLDVLVSHVNKHDRAKARLNLRPASCLWSAARNRLC